ncbi:BrnT family toxin [Sphingomonas melonis]|uniref:BrnT family toxin n=1 Tax=Sphingomonas melonis TaxID=152682 RepID=A0A7Y9FNS9_9SPHN|nr:BrnT family toxin [Sphingomonas melonis]NYD89536.1 hypothetical protein [Sphingomonas melonis]
MEITFDPAKDVINRAKHGVPLAFGERIFADDNVLLIPSARPEDGEERWKAVGMVGDRLWTAVYVERDQTTRFISVRKSNDAEARGYHRHSGRS